MCRQADKRPSLPWGSTITESEENTITRRQPHSRQDPPGDEQKPHTRPMTPGELAADSETELENGA